MTHKTVVITGALGFIGRYVAKFYAENGWQVIGLGHGLWPLNDWMKWGLSQWYECDITLENLIEYGCMPDVIVHCAGSGSVGFSINSPMQDFERTVRTTQFILEYVRVYSPKTKIVYPSSAAVYGLTEEIPIVEDCILHPISAYGVNKKIAEDLCLMYAKQYSISIAIVRLFSVYGVGLKKQLLWDACTKLKNGNREFYGSGLETRDWIHVKDAARLLYTAYLKADSSCPIVNGGTGSAILIKDILEELFVSYGVSDMPQFLGTVDEGNPKYYQADMRIVSKWGWWPMIRLKDGITEYVQWYKEGAR